jgi:hypothetical protein
MLKKVIPFFVLLIACYSAAIAQKTAVVKGVVSDTSGYLLSGITLIVQENQTYSTTSIADGSYSLTVPANTNITVVVFGENTVLLKQKYKLAPGDTVVYNPYVNTKVLSLSTFEVKATRTDAGPGIIEFRPNTTVSGPQEGIEAFLQVMGGRNNNELSSNYSVRGGSFDENLVYVNDFEIYRPFLIRSGQQEGLSFVNPAMVENVKFNTGGFQARYGDKMSSVLDVEYKRPKQWHGSVYGSLLGFGGHLEGASKDGRFTMVLGVRQRLSQYFLRSLETQGEYSPNFFDVQGLFTFQATKKFGIELLTNYSRNQYTFKPVTRESTFGLVTDVKKLTIYFDGQEADRYQSLMNGVSLIFTPNENLTLKALGAYYLNREKEAFDILGEYYLSQVESDIGKDNFGEVLYSLGVGGLHNWARNTLTTDVYLAAHRGSWESKNRKHFLRWGLDYKREVIHDKISEWNILDSAGHSLPYVVESGEVNVFSRLKSSFDLKSNRISGFIQDNWKNADLSDTSKWRVGIGYGIRYSYWDVNKEWLTFSPRIQLSIKPKGRQDITITAAGGLYYQPPFYREMRSLDGKVNTNLKSQKSAHAVLGLNYAFKAWKRKFSFVTEVYYKHMWDLVPYEYDNVLIRYYGSNSSKGYAAGVDFRLNGELVEGAESWISLSVMSTAEDIIGDKYTAYYDSSGKEVANTPALAPRIEDSSTVYPGYIPRPTDQRVAFAMYFQDYIPKFKFIKVNMTLVVATGLPFGPPDRNRYKDVLRTPPYRRLDIGFMGQIWNPKWEKKKQTTFGQALKSAWISLDVFNILGISNTVSYIWVRDVQSRQYAVPNYLSSRRVNVKVMLNF